MNKLKKLVHLSHRILGEDFYFSHEDVRDLALWTRTRYGLDFFRGQDPQKLCYAALAAAASSRKDESSLDERINTKSRMNPKEIDDFYGHMKRVNSLHKKF